MGALRGVFCIAFAACSSLSFPAASECASTAELSCGIYSTCFEKYCPCENTDQGYFLRYGEKYCNRFLTNTGWTEKGKRWRDATLLCLQERIVPKLDISNNPKCDCAEMKTFAFRIHVQCYTLPASSICSLDFQDYKKIYDIIDVRNDLLSDPFGRRQMKEVLDICKGDPNSTLSQASLNLIKKMVELLD